MASFEPQDYGIDEPPPRPETPPIRRGFVIIFLILAFFATLVYGVPYVAETAGYAWETGRSRAATETLEKLDKAGLVNRASELFRLATVAVSPAVVNISTERLRDVPANALIPGGGGAGGRGFESLGIGSGVIIDKENGYVVTNNHVINGADRITVRLSHGAEVSARVVGADPQTDLAVIQLKSPVKVDAQWGDSDKLAIGDWVLAIGSPYMLEHTVTAGILSATGRNNLNLPGMDAGSYQDFLQTDAAINPGNSGGPLIDLNGKIIGINTAILTGGSFSGGNEGMRQSGGFEGIGLAIPSSMARRVVEGLIKNGKVQRGYLGIGIQDLKPAMAKEFNIPDGQGTLVNTVEKGSPADRAGVKVRDVIISIDGKATPDQSTLRTRTAGVAPGTEVNVQLIRDGKPLTFKVVVGEKLAMPPVVSTLGFEVFETPPGNGPDAKPSLVVSKVNRGSSAERRGLVPGLKIVAVGKTEVHTQAEFDRAASSFTVDQGLPLQVALPNGQSGFITIGGPR